MKGCKKKNIYVVRILKIFRKMYVCGKGRTKVLLIRVSAGKVT